MKCDRKGTHKLTYLYQSTHKPRGYVWLD